MIRNAEGKKNSEVKKNPVNRILDTIIALLCIVVILAGAFAVTSFHDSLNLAYDEDSFYYRLEDEAFGQMVEMYYTNEAAGVKADQELQQYYAIAEYFEAASYYKAYAQDGDTERAAVYWEKMETAEVKMGELSFVGEKICETLGIVP